MDFSFKDTRHRREYKTESAIGLEKRAVGFQKTEIASGARDRGTCTY